MQLNKLSHRHQQIVNWLVLNPDRSLTDCARFFGYTLPWLSLVVHSDMFQAVYQARCQEVGQLAVHSIANEMGALTHEVIEKSREKIQAGQASERFLGQVLDTSLRALGYGVQPAGGNGTPISVVVDARTIIDARDQAAQIREGTTAAKVSTNGRQNGNGAQKGIIPLPSVRASLPSLAQAAVEILNPPTAGQLLAQEAADASPSAEDSPIPPGLSGEEQVNWLLRSEG